MIPYLINTFRGGTSDEDDKGVDGSFKFGYGLDIHKKSDSLTANQALLTVFDSSNTTLTGPINFFVNASDGTTYCFGATGSIFSRNGDGDWTYVYNDENGGIRGASEWQVEDGANYLYWATASTLARKRLPGAEVTRDDSVNDNIYQAIWTDATENYKDTLDVADWHTMLPASGSLMIANNNYVAELGYDETFAPGAVNVRPHNIIKALEERDDYLIMGSGRSSKDEDGHIWAWIASDLNYAQKKRVPVKGVNSMINTEFNLIQGGSDGEIFFSDFVETQLLHTIPGGGTTMPGGVAVENDIAVFGMFGGDYPGIWSYGRRQKRRPFALNYEYRLAQTVAGSTISTISAVTVTDGTLFTSWGATESDSSNYGVDQVSSTTKATAVYEGLEFDANKPHIKKNIEMVQLVMAPFPVGGSTAVKFKMDKEDNWRYAVLGTGETTFSEQGETTAEFSIGKPGKIYEVGVEIMPHENTSPEILDITSFVSNTGGQDHG